MREFKFRYIFEDIKEDGRTLVTQIWNLNDIEINDIVYDTEVLIARNQYTGLKDKNDVEIYEGDIVTDGVGKYKIIYDLKLAGYQPYCIFRDDPENYCEVIGNIYENQELLES